MTNWFLGWKWMTISKLKKKQEQLKTMKAIATQIAKEVEEANAVK
jgi:hypothetical protein